MHAHNPYHGRYDLKKLSGHDAMLQQHIVFNPNGEETIDFGSSSAVYELNKAILLADFNLEEYHLPLGYLIPPIPGRLDYLLHLRDFLKDKLNITGDRQLRGLDIGTGANGIYCILGAQHFKWKMVGSESDVRAVEIARTNVERTKALKDLIAIRHQVNKGFLFKNIIQTDELFDFTVCNPPFHSSKEEALKSALRKRTKLEGSYDKEDLALNFEGQANELWCNGGEALFIKRLIKESIQFKDRVRVFSSLVSKADNLPRIEKQLTKSKADYDIIPMSQGQKKSRMVVWWFR